MVRQETDLQGFERDFKEALEEQKAAELSEESAIHSLHIGNFGDGLKLPPGSVLFQNNQIHRGNIPYNRLHFISTKGDLIYKGNHLHAEGPGFINAWLIAGGTLMAVHNRFDERSSASLSAFTQGRIMNDTSDNQANHCISAETPFGLLKDRPNQILDTTGCERRGAIIGAVNRAFFAELYTEEG